MLTNHGGMYLLYKTTFSARIVPLPVYKTIEVLAVYLHSARINLLAIVMYCPCSTAVSCAFFDEFDDVLKRSATFASPIVILGDINIHLDVVINLNTTKFLSSIESHVLVQHVVGQHTTMATCSTYLSHVLISE